MDRGNIEIERKAPDTLMLGGKQIHGRSDRRGLDPARRLSGVRNGKPWRRCRRNRKRPRLLGGSRPREVLDWHAAERCRTWPGEQVQGDRGRPLLLGAHRPRMP